MSLCQADGVGSVGPPYRHRVRNGRQHGDLSGEQRFMGMEHDELHPPKTNMEPKNWWVGLMFLPVQGGYFEVPFHVSFPGV